MITEKKMYDVFQSTKTDKAASHDYHIQYTKLFENFNPESILEIGIKRGASLAAWKTLFPKCKITGIDITDSEFDQSLIEYSSATIILGDATKKEILQDIQESYDVIIDDGSHRYEDILKSFELLKERFKYYYIIEDSLYMQKETVEIIKSMGFAVQLFPSKTKNVKINKESSKKYIGNEYVSEVSLYMIVVYRQ